MNNIVHTQCKNPKCKKWGDHIVKYSFDTSDPKHKHLICCYCGYNFNYWLCHPKIIKRIFGSSFENYL